MGTWPQGVALDYHLPGFQPFESAFIDVNQRWKIFRLLTPALSSFEEERENYFVGRLPRVALTLFADPGLLSFARWGKSVWLRVKTQRLRFAGSGGRRPGPR
ncbi:MAG: hypothetical protein DME24_06810 [Verrucomicrobia bacterium]|nr:MAG: hypothetical protein DME24_06810 [Verrucomicrobiota bacterium]